MGNEDELDALFGAEEELRPEAEEPQPQAEPVPEAEPEPQPEVQADLPQPALAAPVVDHKPEPGFVPIQAVLDERDRRKKAEEERDRYLAAQQPQQVPDIFEDQQAYNAYVQSQVEMARYQDRLFMSERLAKVEHGADTFAKAKEWGLARCDADPFFNAKVRASQDPYGVVMEEWKREQTASIPTDEFEQFKAWKAAQAQLAQPQSAAPATPQSVASAPPRSIASAPSAGNVTTQVDEGDPFDAMFPKR